MKVGIDAHALGTQAGGNETFVRLLLLGLRSVAPDIDLVAYVNPGFPADSDLAAGFPVHFLSTRSSVSRVLYGLSAAVRDTHPDLLHVQYIAPPKCPCPFVVTLHDMAWKRVPETLPFHDRIRLAAWVPGALKRAARVLVVSDAMKREAMEIYRVPEDKLDVTPNSVDPRYRPVTDVERLATVRARYGLPERFVLYVGAIQPRKNLTRLATACKRLFQKGFPHALVIAGKPGWLHRRVLDELCALDLRDRLILPGYVDADDLPAFYAAADAFAYVSLYEGFGLPVVEAMACGTPVLTSTDPALAEVAGDAALLCDARDVEAIQSSLERVLTDDTLRRRLRLAGFERAGHFTPRAMASAALTAYRRACKAP